VLLKHALFADDTAREWPPGDLRAALFHLLRTVFGQRWIGQHRFTTTAEWEALHAALHVGVGARVLDIGSGLGGPAIYLAQKRGCHVTGIDASAESVQQARAAALKAGLAHRLDFVAGDVLTAHFSAGAFDAIMSHDAMVAIPNKARLLAQCRHWLRPGGRLAAALIVNRGGPMYQATHSSLLAWTIPTAEEYHRLARQAGLHVLAIDDLTPSFRDISARWRGALLAWESALVPHHGYQDWEMVRATVGRLAEWATQGRLGHSQLTALRKSGSS
jgi:cyclopropane fatty-acyl-phospholipid synthase-like methyltransferase